MFSEIHHSEQKSGKAWLTSLTLHVLGVAVLASFGGALVKPPARPAAAKLFLMSPPPDISAPAPLPPIKLQTFKVPTLPKPVETARQMALPEAPAIQAAPTPPPATRPLATMAPPALAPPPPPQPAPPQIKTGMLDAPRIAAATPASRPALPVQSAGFDGGSTKPAAQSEPKRVASVGAFGGPGIPGKAPADARRAVVSDGGFGNTVVANGVANSQQPAAREAAAPADRNPIEITFKPRPVYTEEARRRQIEGEVVLEVVFTASGDLRVLRVVRGLGHGLDESAVTAAHSIRFRPAKQNGRPVDSTATIRLSFELAY